MKTPDIPFYILVLAPLCPVPDAGQAARNVPVVSVNSVDDALAFLAPSLWIPLPREICPDGGVTLRPMRMKHLSPDGMIQSTPYLKDLHEAGTHIEEMWKGGSSASAIAETVRSKWPRLPVDLSLRQEGHAPPSGAAVDQILSMVAMPNQGASSAIDADSEPVKWKKQIDGILSEIMTLIFSGDDFRAFEASWRGLEGMFRQTAARVPLSVKIDIVPISSTTMTDVLDALTERLMVNPPNLVLIDLSFDNNPVSLDQMEKMAALGEMLLSPVVFSLNPGFFHLRAWQELSRLSYLGHYIEDASFAKWRNLRKQSAARWLAATCNRFLMRPPYGNDNRPRTVFFREETPLWINPVWALGMLVIQSVSQYGWPSRFTDYRHVLLKDLAVVTNDSGMAVSAEAVIPDERIKQFTEIGITPLTGSANKDVALMPHETTVAGDSLQDQLFFSFLIGFLLRCRDSFIFSSGDEDIEARVQGALSEFFRRQGHESPPDLTVKVRASEGRTVPVEIAFTPHPSWLPGSGKKLAFTLSI